LYKFGMLPSGSAKKELILQGGRDNEQYKETECDDTTREKRHYFTPHRSSRASC